MIFDLVYLFLSQHVGYVLSLGILSLSDLLMHHDDETQSREGSLFIDETGVIIAIIFSLDGRACYNEEVYSFDLDNRLISVDRVDKVR